MLQRRKIIFTSILAILIGSVVGVILFNARPEAPDSRSSLLFNASGGGDNFQTVKAKAADTLIDSFGVQLYINEVAPYNCNNDQCLDNIIIPRLNDLGVRNFRSSLYPSAVQYPGLNPSYEWLLVKMRKLYSKTGARCYCFVITPDKTADGFYQPDQVIKQIKADASMIEAFLGPNEYNNISLNWGDDPNNRPADWVRRIRDYHAQIYSAFKADSQLSQLPIVGSSFVYENEQDDIGSLSSWVDYGSTNYYNAYWRLDEFGGNVPADHLVPLGGQPYTLDRQLQYFKMPYGGKPMIITETGYLAVPNLNDVAGDKRGNFVTDTVAAKYLPRRLFEMYNRDLKKFFVYLFADFADNRQDERGPIRFGLLNGDGSPKPVFNSLKNIFTILRDPGSSFSTGSLTYNLQAPANVHQTLLQKRNGTYYLALWNETISNDNPKTESATVVFNSSMKTTTYKPSDSAQAVGTQTDTAIALEIGDAITIVEISPAESSQGGGNSSSGGSSGQNGNSGTSKKSSGSSKKSAAVPPPVQE